MNALRTKLLLVILGITAVAFAGSAPKPSAGNSPTVLVTSTEQDQQWRLEGEKRYRENCGRCHQPPHKFPPRAMAMAVRHMRVRAMLTDDDMKYLLYYLTH